MTQMRCCLGTATVTRAFDGSNPLTAVGGFRRNESMTDLLERLDRRFAVVVSAALAALAGFWVATLAGVPAGALDLAYTVLLALVPPLAWWAAMRAPLYLRPFVTIAAGAVTAQA